MAYGLHWFLIQKKLFALSSADGAREQGAEVDLFQVSDFDASMLENYDALAFGCPAMGSEELESEEFQPLWDEVKDHLGERKVVLFGSYEWADGEWLENWKADAEDASVNVIDSLAAYDAPPVRRSKPPARHWALRWHSQRLPKGCRTAVKRLSNNGQKKL